MNRRVQYSGMSSKSSISWLRWDSSSLKISQSVTVTRVLAAIMGIASTASATS